VIDFLVAEQNLPFTAAIGVMLGLTLLEVLLLTVGGSMSGAFDNLAPEIPDLDIDVDLDSDAAPTAGSGDGLGRVLGWFAIGKVPLLVVIVAFLTIFGLSGLILQNVWSGIAGSMLPASLASAPAFIVGLMTTRSLAFGLARLIPNSETSAVSSDSFVGRVAVLTLGTAASGKPAQAKLTDGHGQTHYLLVEPDQAEMVFQQGDRVLLVGRVAGVFKGIPNQSDVLVDH
jgi:hypothetical protein